MKSIIKYINESKWTTSVKKCKTFGEFFFLYTGYSSIDELTKDDYEAYDYGFLFNQEGDSFEEFKKWFDKVKDNKITNIKFQDINGHGGVSFNMGEEVFDMDFDDSEY